MPQGKGTYGSKVGRPPKNKTVTLPKRNGRTLTNKKNQKK